MRDASAHTSSVDAPRPTSARICATRALAASSGLLPAAADGVVNEVAGAAATNEEDEEDEGPALADEDGST